MLPSKVNRLALGVVIFASSAFAFFRLPCASPLIIERADPIISPGQVSGHVHTVMGGNGFGFNMDYAATQASTCSSCTVVQDKSNYWVPVSFLISICLQIISRILPRLTLSLTLHVDGLLQGSEWKLH
jgi:hypothetical protein